MAKSTSFETTIRSLFHDIRNPLAVINNSLYFIKAKVGANADPKVAKHLKILESEIQRANDILTQSLNYFVDPPLKPETTSLNDLLGNLASSATLPPKVTVKKDFAPVALSVKVDRMEILRALSALVSNALEAMTEGGVLTVRTRADGKWAVLEFADTGGAISAEARAKLFTPFSTTKQGHLGLGLAIAQKIVLRHKGRIEVAASAPGTVARIFLPL